MTRGVVSAMTGFLMIILAAAGLVMAFEIGRLVYVAEKDGRCIVCDGTACGPAGDVDRPVSLGHQLDQFPPEPGVSQGLRCGGCGGTGRARR